MEFNRRVRDRMCLILLLLGNIATVALSDLDNETGLNLYCTNDFNDLMSCNFDAQNCTEYNLTLRSKDGHGEQRCITKQCDTGRCCCSVRMVLIAGESHNATVFKGGQSVESKYIDITASIKPKAPTIISVTESNGNFEVKWKANCYRNSLRSRLSARVTYHKKGDTKEVSEDTKKTVVDGPNYFDILGEHLEPSTTYLVSMKSYTSMSGLFSDSSKEYEFTTPVSRKVVLLAVIISLSTVAVIISSAIFCSYVKLKAKWWDSVAENPNSKVFLVHPSEQEVLKPIPPVICSISVEPFVPDDSKPWSKGSLMYSSGSPQPSSGISTGSSSLSYANTEPSDIIAGVQDALCKAFANISPISPVTTNPLTESNKDSGLFSAPNDLGSGSSGFDNKTYSILIPGCACQTVMDSSENQTEAEMFCDSAYHPSEGDMMTCLDKQAPACLLPEQQDIISPPVVSSFMPTDMSYQCNVDSGRFSYAEDSSLSSVSSGTNTTASCDLTSRVENFDEVLSGATKPDGKSEGVTVCDENPCYNCVPASLHSFPPVDDDYQAFETLVKQPDILFSEQGSGEEEEHLDKYPEKSSTEIPKSFLSSVFPDFTNDVQGGQCLSELQKPFLSLMSAVQSTPIITDNGYQSV